MRKITALIFVFAMIIFNNCKNGNTPETQNEQPETAILPPAEKCERPEVKGTVYHFHELINKSACELANNEDSAGWDLVFINDSQFVQVSYFPSDFFIKEGNYFWEKDSLQLVFDSIRVDRIYAKVTSTADELMKGDALKKIPIAITNEREIGAKSIEKLSLRKCDNGTVYMAWHDLTLTQIMPEDNGVKMAITAEDYQKQMKADGYWGLLFDNSKQK